jgi:adenylosuccinate lyase
MRSIFEDENRFQRMLDVEAALAKALATVNMIPNADARKIARSASIKRVGVARIRKLEREIRHETMALVLALAKISGKAGRYVHLGATSNDILDTAAALQIRDGLTIVERDIRKLLRIILKQAAKYKNTIMVGRTHGQHAVPTTLGLKFAIWGCEIGRHLERLEQLRTRVIVGKMSGAVGTGAAWGTKGPKVQELVMQELKIPAATASNQILQRDRFAELVSFFGLLGSTLDKIAREIRNLQRTEIGELAEPFAEQQIGSSTMPHKRNPIQCEKIGGLARTLRANVQAGLENIVIEHERDMTNSSCERVLLPECFLLIDEMLKTSLYVLDNLLVFPERMKHNLELTHGLHMAEAVMIELTRRGMNRQEAHALLRKCSSTSVRDNIPFALVLRRDREVTQYIPEREIEKLLDPRKYIGSAAAIVERVVKELRSLARE